MGLMREGRLDKLFFAQLTWAVSFLGVVLIIAGLVVVPWWVIILGAGAVPAFPAYAFACMSGAI